MPTETQADIQQRMDLRSKALAANRAELPQLEITLGKLDALLGEVNSLRAQQASLTAAKQEVSKRLAALLSEGQKLMTFVDAGIRSHYGSRAEKLVEFGLQPFRSQPRIRLIGFDGKPLKRGAVLPEPPAPPVTPPAPATE
ncbi:MAG TPA: hypothetical protein VKM72_12865 [Thermoanaerobaculia bacterium]|nr:hypothetical protein [Thermoanaerobaculia bacterium]